MKKILVIALLISSVFANANFDKNFQKTIKEVADIEIEVQFKKELKSFPAFFVIGKTKGGDLFPVISNKNGDYFFGLSNVMHLDEKDSSMIRSELNKAQAQKNKQDKVVLDKLFSSFSDNDYLFLEGNSKNLPTQIVVSDPDCPYCRKHLDEIEDTLKVANVKYIFAPVHEGDAFVKSQLIMDEAKNLKSTKDKIKVMKKYYKDIELSKKQLGTNTSQIDKNAKKIFESGVIRGVPFVYEVE
ncbi:thiol peroxidase [Helicobacter sp. WB40]|uniref:thiol peroxidase n=1 Tax=Helicobacter sp. WB40 TaxID=3004130 RepID=UPI0022EBDD77|nr:thiol peroxidase [Helicobacter sp. WB40]MDA3967138.1 thiol peroxidase [Helicobacter sp. WB40]